MKLKTNVRVNTSQFTTKSVRNKRKFAFVNWFLYSHKCNSGKNHQVWGTRIQVISMYHVTSETRIRFSVNGYGKCEIVCKAINDVLNSPFDWFD